MKISELPTAEWMCSCGAKVGAIRLICEVCGGHKGDLRPVLTARETYVALSLLALSCGKHDEFQAGMQALRDKATAS